MKNLRTIKYAIRAILRNPTRTFLTTLGIVIGIASVIALMEIGAGAQESIKGNFSSMGVNTIMIRPGTVMTAGITSGTRANLTAQDAEAILKGCPDVMAASPVVSVRGQVVYAGKNWLPYSIVGVNAEYFKIANWKISDGEFFDELKVLRGSKVCLIGSTVARELFGSENPVGKDLRVQSVLFKIIGVLQTKGANMMGMDQDDTVIAPWTAVKSRLKGAGQSSLSSASVTSSTASSTSTASTVYPGSVSFYAPASSSNIPPVRFTNVDSISVSAVTSEKVNAAVKQITEVLRRTHRIGEGVEDDFSIRTLNEFADFMTSSTKNITNLLLCVGLISLVVGGIGIMNIMLVSVTERTREIGLRMAVGAKKNDILKQFLIEAIVICLMGGLIGILLGHGASLGLAQAFGWPTTTSYTAILLSVGVSAGVGLVFGYYPAWKAARLDPIEALRYE